MVSRPTLGCAASSGTPSVSYVTVCGLLVMSCGAASGPATVTLPPSVSTTRSVAPPSPKAEQAVNALIATTCGPTDGPATTLVVAEHGRLTCDAWGAIGPRSRFVVETWDLLSIERGKTEHLPGSHGGAVRLCASDDCLDLGRASLRVDNVTEDGFVGELDVQAGHAFLKLPVRARRCVLHQMCG